MGSAAPHQEGWYSRVLADTFWKRTSEMLPLSLRRQVVEAAAERGLDASAASVNVCQTQPLYSKASPACLQQSCSSTGACPSLPELYGQCSVGVCDGQPRKADVAHVCHALAAQLDGR